MKNAVQTGNRREARGDGQSGAAMVEFAVVFPLQLLVFLMGVQLCLILVGKQVVNYAAFCAARAELVGESPEDAAAIACISIGGVSTAGGTAAPAALPGWDGNAPDLDVLSMRAREKLTLPGVDGIQVLETPSNGTGRVVVRVRFPFEMMIPLANWVIFYAMDGMNPGLVHFDSVENSGSLPDAMLAMVIGDVPHLVIQEDGVLAANWPSPTQVPHDIVTEPEDPE